LKRKQKRDADQHPIRDYQDEQFAFIAGYTSGGALFGLTWEEAGENPFGDEDDAEA